MTETNLEPVVIPEEKVEQLRGLLDGQSNPKPAEGNNADVALDAYDIEPARLHLYKRAKIEDTPEGPRWIVEAFEYMSVEKRMGGTGRVGKTKSSRDPLNNLGTYMTAMELAEGGWQAIQVIPSVGGMAGVLYRRKVKYVLETPELLVKETERPPITDTELNAYTEKANAWAEQKDPA